MSTELAELWRKYKLTNSLALRNQLIENYLEIANRFARVFAARVPRHVGEDVIQSAAQLGLIDAVEGFDPDRGIQFETYCSVRIRGSILDELRSKDWVPRQVRAGSQKFKARISELSKKLGRKPTDFEIMRELNLSPRMYHDLRTESARLTVLSLDSKGEDESDLHESNHPRNRLASLIDRSGLDPAQPLHAPEAVAKLLAGLTFEERALVQMYYFEGLKMKEIGRILKLSECRISQILAALIQRLQTKFAGRKTEFSP